MKRIDIHTHTHYSDGTSTVTNSLTKASELGLSLFSVTDHNTVDAYGEITEKRELFGGKILPGVELSTVFRDEVIEILGYGIDVEAMKQFISDNYYTFYEKQVREARLDVLAVLERGAVLDEDFVRRMLEDPESIFDPYHKTNRPYLLKELKRHPENARFFSSREEFENITSQAFSRQYLFNAKSPLFSDQSSLSPTIDEVIEGIHRCGGLAFLAHAFVYSENIISSLDEVASHGLDGLECYYGTFNADQKRFMCDYCDTHGLFKSGGSDYHGPGMRAANVMGCSDGEIIEFALIEPWFSRVENSLI